MYKFVAYILRLRHGAPPLRMTGSGTRFSERCFITAMWFRLVIVTSSPRALRTVEDACPYNRLAERRGNGVPENPLILGAKTPLPTIFQKLRFWRRKFLGERGLFSKSPLQKTKNKKQKTKNKKQKTKKKKAPKKMLFISVFPIRFQDGLRREKHKPS